LSSITANLSFRPKQTDAFSSTFAPAKVSVCAAEKCLFDLPRSPADFSRLKGIFSSVQCTRADVPNPKKGAKENLPRL